LTIKTRPQRPSMILSTGNLTSSVPQKLKEEQFTELAASEHVRIERIVSRGQASASDDWYDEDEAEWVMVVTGAARLVFDGEEVPRALGPGDYVYIPPRKRHRVEWTDPHQPTVWLAVHFR
jgi:cupin 2 domain-containing protein